MLRLVCSVRTPDATLSELRLREVSACSPGLPKRNPGLELANAFSVIRRTALERCVEPPALKKSSVAASRLATRQTAMTCASETRPPSRSAPVQTSPALQVAPTLVSLV